MYLGAYYRCDSIRVTVPFHRFQSGQEYNGTGKIRYGLMKQGWVAGTEKVLAVFGSQTGLMTVEWNACDLDNGMYWCVLKATIDLVDVQQTYTFRVMDEPMWLLGVF